MRSSPPRPTLQLAMVAALFVALALLALLQYRWIAQLSDAERERLKAWLAASALQFCDGLDRELDRAYRAFRVEGDTPGDGLAEALAGRLAAWRATAAHPSLVEEILVVRHAAGGEVELLRFDGASRSLRPAQWDEGLDSVRRIFGRRGRVPLLDGELPGLVLPVAEGRGPGENRPPRDHIVVRLDGAFVRNDLLPRLAAGAFGDGGGLAVSVRVVVAERPDRVVFAAGPRGGAEDGTRPELARPLFALRTHPESEGGAPARPAPLAERPRRADPEDDARPVRPPEGAEAGVWTLEVRHPAGSLEAAVAGARRRNLAVSGAILALLATAGVLLIVSTRRAQRLARQQLEFVAGVSHELRTPLTAMRSAGQNLADGIVTDPDRVRSYGALIEREGRRLTEMVARVLAFAGIRSGQPSYAVEPLDVRALVEGVLADSRWVLEEKLFEVETLVADDVPQVRGDASALRQALSNLVDNAMKYGAPGRWIGVRATSAATPHGIEVAIAVSDRGPGIRRSDMARLFEPFFRGRDARAGAAPGSGLGLAVVKGIVAAHGGRVTVESSPGRGSTFAIHLPAAAPAGGRGTR